MNSGTQPGLIAGLLFSVAIRISQVSAYRRQCVRDFHVEAPAQERPEQGRAYLQPLTQLQIAHYHLSARASAWVGNDSNF